MKITSILLKADWRNLIMNNQVIKSPIFYMGNKERLIKKGLIDLFPKNINKFIDCFCAL